jgi:hypothetical protein
MGTIKLTRIKHSILFHSPFSPHLTVKKSLLKKSLQEKAFCLRKEKV